MERETPYQGERIAQLRSADDETIFLLFDGEDLLVDVHGDDQAYRHTTRLTLNEVEQMIQWLGEAKGLMLSRTGSRPRVMCAETRAYWNDVRQTKYFGPPKESA